MILTSTRITFRCLGILVEGWDKNIRVSSKDITDYGGFPERTITPNLVKMVKAGVLNSIAGGRNRGYKLSKDPRDINMAELLEILEGKVHFRCCNDILNVGAKCKNRRENCTIYNSINEATVDVLNKLGDLSLREYVQSSLIYSDELIYH